MDEIQRMALFGRPEWLAHFNPDEVRSPEGFDLAGVAFTNLVKFHGELDDALAKIDANPDLTLEGKEKRKRDVPASVQKRFDQLKAVHATSGVHLERKAAEIFPTDEEPTTAEATAFSAIWSHLPHDSFKVKQLHGEAVQKGQDVVARAIEMMPFFMPGALPAETVAELRNERLGNSVDPISRARYERHKAAIEDGARAIDIIEERLKGLSKPTSREELADQLAQQIAEEDAA